MALTNEGALLTDRQRRLQVRTAITADSQARRLWDSTLDLDDLKGSQPAWRRAMIRLLETWWKISAEQAADYLPEFRRAEIGGKTISVDMPKFDRKAKAADIDWLGSTNVLWHIDTGQKPQDAYQSARNLFLGEFHKQVMDGGRRTMREWASNDSQAIGWRRVSDGHPCAFCAMLVSRGPVYTSERKALLRASDRTKFHPNCGCSVEVVYGDWQPTQQEQQWVDTYYVAAESLPKNEPRSADSILPIMRRIGAFRDSPKTIKG